MISGRWTERVVVDVEQLRNAWCVFVGRIPWEVMATLTFDPRKVFPASQWVADREAFRWCGLVGMVTRRPIAWLYATERHRSGAWHAHALVAGLGARSCRAAVAMWEDRNGIARLRTIYNTPGAILYVTKQAAAGEVTVSDTLERYRDHLARDITVQLSVRDATHSRIE